MSRAYIKICGVKDLKIAKSAVVCGAAFLGFVFFWGRIWFVMGPPIGAPKESF